MGFKDQRKCLKKLPFTYEEALQKEEYFKRCSRSLKKYHCKSCGFYHFTSQKDGEVVYAPDSVLRAAGIKS